MEAVVEALLQANVDLTKQVVALAEAVITGGGYASPQPYQRSTPMSFDKFTESDEMSETERLFYSEEEEDEKFSHDLNGGASDATLTHAILKAAGHEDLAESITIEPA